MNKIIQLKEFQNIVSKKDYENEGNKYLPEKDFKELISFIEEFVGSEEETDVMDFMKVYKTKDRNLGTVVKVNNYVGLIQLKSGYKIEILPKIDFTDDEENNKKLARNAIILLVISILLFLFSHFVLIKQGEKFKQEIPALKENKQKLEKEVEVLNGNIKHGEDSYKKVEALINKYK